MDKKILLLVVALACVVLYFYGSQVKDSQYFKFLPVIGGLTFGLKTLVDLAN